MQIYSINLSIFICYYLRLSNYEQRKELEKRINCILDKFKKNYIDLEDFLNLPIKEEKFIISNIKLDKGIAINRILLENIFALFVAINNKIPIFIIGKSDCSKSLCLKLIIQAMKGSESNNAFFKKYPKIIIHSHKDSFVNKTKYIKNIFKKTLEKISQINIEDKKKIINLIYFDNISLQEHSTNNELKIIINELEYNEKENNRQITFVCISRWNLDSSTMNKGILLSIPELNEKEYKEIAFNIGISFDKNIAIKYKNLFENLGKCYYKYKNYLRKRYYENINIELHEDRDFYHLVKNSARNLINKEKQNELNNESLLDCVIDSIERNFSGIKFKENNKTSLELFKELLHEIYPSCQIKNEHDLLKKIKENLNDIDGRYLLISSQNSICNFLLSTILEDENKDYKFIIGSPFEQDLNSEEYILKVLKKIQAYMGQGKILILKNLEFLYPSLYDLFKQNFTAINNKNYLRLAFGTNTNIFSFVNKDFRCIINIEKDKLSQLDASFLNIFEKHIMSFEYIMDDELIKESEKIKNIIDEFSNCNNKIFKAINYVLKKLMINCGKLRNPSFSL